jgi:O-antigen/teichoic acid export membrane protein
MLGSQLLSIARFLILARLLAPEAFGLLAIAAVAIGLLEGLSQSGMAAALVQRDDPEDVHYDTAWTIAVARGIAIAAAMFAAAPLIAEIFDEPAATTVLRVIAFRPLLSALVSAKLPLLQRELHFRRLAAIRLVGAATDALVSIAAALLIMQVIDPDTSILGLIRPAVGVWALAAGAIGGSLATVAMSYALVPHRPRLRLDPAAARSLFRFGRWILVGRIVGVVGYFALRAVVSRRLGTAELGVFYLGMRLAGMPFAAVTEIVAGVGFPVISRVKSDLARARRILQALLAAMLVVLLPSYAMLFGLSDSVARNVLGSKWLVIVPVLQILAVDGIVKILGAALRPVFRGVGQPNRHAGLKAIRTAALLGLVWPFVGAWGLAGAAAAWLAAESLVFVVALFLVRHSVPQPFSGFGPAFLAMSATALLAGVLAWTLDQLLPGIGGLAAGALAGTVAAGTTLMALDRRLHLGLVADLIKAFPRSAHLLRNRVPTT